MKRILLLLTVVFVSTFSFGQKKKKQDISSIMDMCGCYEISFNFAETFSPNADYEYHDNYKSGALEFVLPIETGDKDKLMLQHLLVINDTMIIKHWRQDWIYENTHLYEYDHSNKWKYVTANKEAVKGQWTQKVYQVDDSPRYEGSGSWVHVDGKHYWENTTSAPLPRREFSKRSDYNVMVRKNRHEITDYGWNHEQDNQKVIREDGEDSLLAWEKGWNTYTKVDSKRCDPAKNWWKENNEYWADVRSVWDELFGKKSMIAINMKVDDKIMFQRLFALQDELKGSDYTSEKARVEIQKVINMHLSKNNQLAIN